MHAHDMNDYNREQLATFQAVSQACLRLTSIEREALIIRLAPYLVFRRDLDELHHGHVESTCRTACYETGLSACCGFESIITFFADHVITCLLSEPSDMRVIFERLEQPNRSRSCVYLAEHGCMWKVRPIACAMFFCESIKSKILRETPAVFAAWEDLQRREKGFTLPDRPVLFDDLEAYFIERGVSSPHMHFHNSPGLLRMKARHGLADRKREVRP